MLTNPKLRSQVDALWDKFWTGGLSNPLSLQDESTGVVARVEGLRGRMSVLSNTFGGGE